jgi:hypothetical protein
MSRKLVRRPTPRLSTEREVWQRINKRGKLPFVARFTLILGCLLFVIVLSIQLFTSKHRFSAPEFAGAATLCLCAGYVGGSLLWQRGQTILRQPNPANKYRR